MVISLTRAEANTREALHAAGIRAALRAARKACGAKTNARAVHIQKDALGKPFALCGTTTIALSISHSYPFALGAAEANTDCLVGADIERVRDFSEAFWLAFSTKRERAAVDTLPLEERARAKTLCWSLKESVLKALGTGLRMHPCRVDVSETLFARSGKLASITLDSRRCTARVWQPQADNGYVAAAIALPRGGAIIEILPAHSLPWSQSLSVS